MSLIVYDPTLTLFTMQPCFSDPSSTLNKLYKQEMKEMNYHIRINYGIPMTNQPSAKTKHPCAVYLDDNSGRVLDSSQPVGWLFD